MGPIESGYIVRGRTRPINRISLRVGGGARVGYITISQKEAADRDPLPLSLRESLYL